MPEARSLLHQSDAATCEHPDVRYFKDEKGAVACMVCGRLFGHLAGETFTAFNPTRVESITPARAREMAAMFLANAEALEVEALATGLRRSGMTHQALADALGVTQSAVTHWLSGRYKPTQEHVRRATEVFASREDSHG